MTERTTDTANDSFLEVLGLTPGAPLDTVEAKFLDVIRARIQAVAESYDENAVKAEERTLRLLHEQFFRTSMLWAASELKKPREAPDHMDAAKQKKKARTLIEALQGNIIEFALCYMHINRFSTLLRDEIRNAEVQAGGTLATNVKWTSDAGVLMARHKKQRRELLDAARRMADMREVLNAVDNDLMTVKRALPILFGADKSEPYLRKIIAALRTGEFARARAAVVEICDAKKKFGTDSKGQAEQQAALEAAANNAIAMVEKHKDGLASPEEGKLFLRPIETDIAYNNNVRELRRIRAFLAKYHAPYMEYKLSTLYHLKEKLMVVGSLDSLMVLYRRLLGGLASPMPDIRDVRMYESEVVDKAAFMLDGQFQEIPKILERAVETVQEFRQNSADVAESAADDDLQEVAVESQDSAANG